MGVQAQVLWRRLASQRLVGDGFGSVPDAVRAFGAMQAQDYPATCWALAQRVPGISRADIDRVLGEGLVVRTHVMRPTWHLVAGQDARWLLELTGPRVLQAMGGRLRRLELERRDLDRAFDLIGEALAGGKALTRREVGRLLEASGLSAEGQRLPHILAAAELSCVIVSGPWRKWEATYMLMDERLPGQGGRDRDESLGDLARRYFNTHGPARLQDFAWWSGLTLTECRRAAEIAGLDLELELEPQTRDHCLHLLPNFDEYTVGYRDRSALVDPAVEFRPELFRFRNVLSNVVTIDGLVAGAWARRDSRIEVRPLRPFDAWERDLALRQCELMGGFSGGRAPVLDLP